jgi:hypothetical protein
MDGICLELHLNQGGKDLKVEKGRSELHIGGDEPELKIYIPLDEKRQELCFWLAGVDYDRSIDPNLRSTV